MPRTPSALEQSINCTSFPRRDVTHAVALEEEEKQKNLRSPRLNKLVDPYRHGMLMSIEHGSIHAASRAEMRVPYYTSRTPRQPCDLDAPIPDIAEGTQLHVLGEPLLEVAAAVVKNACSRLCTCDSLRLFQCAGVGVYVLVRPQSQHNTTQQEQHHVIASHAIIFVICFGPFVC
jgi:hypothetical protein